MDVLAENLASLTEQHGWTAEHLAARTSLRVEDVSQYLAGTARPCPRHQGALALALGVTPADLHREEIL